MTNSNKKSRTFYSVILLLTMCNLFTACSEHGNETEVSDLTNILQKSKWILHEAEFNVYSLTELEYRTDGHTLYFITDSEGWDVTVTKIIDTFGNGNKTYDRDISKFSYSISGNKVYMRYNVSGSRTLTYSNGELSDENLIYSPLTLNSSDYEFLRSAGPQTGRTGSCTYTYDPDYYELHISGNGAMADYSAGSQPWKDFVISDIIIEEGVTVIGRNAFNNVGNSNVGFISLPSSSLKEIKAEAFSNLSLLDQVAIPGSVETIGEAAFANCKKLKQVLLPNDLLDNPKLKTIEDMAFNGCSIQNAIDIPNSVETIGNAAFTGSFTSVTLGNSVKKLGMAPFLSSASSGRMYVNRGTPPSAYNDVTTSDSRWTLYVPTGCKSAYQKASPWKNFKSIVEDSGLGEGVDNAGQGSDNQTENAEIRIFSVEGVQFNMVKIEGGTFQMGSNDSEAYFNERPVHQVQLSSYSISQTEVTQELWEAVMGTNPSNWKGLKLPVEKVSWNDCQTFITKLNQLTGQRFRLPTEAEWEFAARGGTKSKGYKYSGSNTVDDVAWYSGNSSDKTHEVAAKQANELSIYDMSGNVDEWCQDWYNGLYYSSSVINNPTGPTSGSGRVLRGGSCIYNATRCRVAYRGGDKPSFAHYYLGLRLAL